MLTQLTKKTKYMELKTMITKTKVGSLYGEIMCSLLYWIPVKFRFWNIIKTKRQSTL